MGLSKAFFILLVSSPGVFAAGPKTKIGFWDEQRRGANLFDSVERADRLRAAKDFGAQLVRLAPNKWLNGRPRSEIGDFLVGRPGSFKTIDPKDLRALRRVLDQADAVGLKVVLAMLSLPEARWKQHNHDVEERGIWADFSRQEIAISFWKQLAAALKGHPALVGYEIRNEPSPEFLEPRLKDWYTGDYPAWYEKVRGTPADINLFYQKVVKAIREVDVDTPIVLDSGFYSTAWGFKVLRPVPDDKTIYSFHMYEPYSFNSRFNKGRYEYPGDAPIGELADAPVVHWDKDQLAKYLAPVSEWQERYGIPRNRIFVGEVGVFRTNSGAQAYLKDVLDLIDGHGWHWAFYSFREDTWAGMDYELGTGEPGWRYWDAIEHGRIPDTYEPNPLSDVLKAALHPKPLSGSSLLR